MRYSVLVGVVPNFLEDVRFEVESMFTDIDSENIIDAKDRAINRAMELKDTFHVKVVETSDNDFRLYSETFIGEYLLNGNNVVFDTEKPKDVRSVLDKIERTESLISVYPDLKSESKKLLLAFDTQEETNRKILNFNKICFMAKELESKGVDCTIIEHSSAGSSLLPDSKFLLSNFNPYSEYALFDENEKSINLDEKEFYVIYNQRNEEFYLKLLDKGEDATFMVNNLDLSEQWGSVNWVSIKVDELLKEYNANNDVIPILDLSDINKNEKKLLKVIAFKKEDTEYQRFYNRINPTYKSCINKEVFRTIKDLEQNNKYLVLNPETPSYMFKNKEGNFTFATPTGYKQIEFTYEKLDYDKAIEMANRYSLKNAFQREFGEREDTNTKSKNPTKNK